MPVILDFYISDSSRPLVKPTAEMLPPKPPAGSSGLFHQETPRHPHESTREAGTAEFKRVAEAWNALSEPEKMVCIVFLMYVVLNVHV